VIQKFFERNFGMQFVRKLINPSVCVARLMGVPEFYVHKRVLDPKIKRTLYI